MFTPYFADVPADPGSLLDAANASVAALAVIDPIGGGISAANPGFCALVGGALQSRIGYPVFWDLIDIAERETVRAEFAAAAADSREINLDARIAAGSGQPIPILIKGSALAPDSDHGTLRYAVGLHDVSVWRDKVTMLELCMSAGPIGWFRRNFAECTFDAGPITRTMRNLPQNDDPIPNRDWFGSILADDFDRVYEELTQSYLRREPYASSAYRVIDPVTGFMRHHEARLHFRYDANGECETGFGVLVDVTSLREAEAMLRLCMEIGKVGTFRRSFEHDTVEMCDAYLQIMGLPADEPVIPVPRWLDLIAPRDRDRVSAHVAACRARRETEILSTFQIRQPSTGQFRHIEARSRSEYGADGEPLSFMGVVTDVTERHDADAMLRLSLEIGKVGTHRRNYVDNTIHCGEEFLRIMGLPIHEPVISRELWRDLIVPDDRDRAIALVAECMARREPESFTSFRIRQRSTGRIRYIESRLRFEYGARGEPLSSMGVVIDMTERREAESILQISMEIGKIGNYRHDMVSGKIHCSETIRKIAGLPKDVEMISFGDWLELVVPEDRDQLVRTWTDELARRQTEFTLSFRMNHGIDGNIRHLEARSRAEYDEDGRPFSIQGVVIDITERREAEARIEHMAMHDGLTGLPNRALFRDRLGQALARSQIGGGFALLFIDLDRFREVNDSLGYPVGDSLIRAVAERLGGELGTLDTLARLGGDEFAVIQSNCDQPEAASALASRIVTCLGRPFGIGGYRIVVGGSVGIAIAPNDGADCESLNQAADIALYQAKADGRGCWRMFASEMAQRVKARRSLEADLRHAIEADELEVFYQPIVSVFTRRVTGFEALMRWRHPERGLIMPDLFIPLAEETGLIVAMGDWLYRRATGDAASWPDHLSISVNLSAVEFDDSSLGTRIVAAVEAAGLAPHRLILEITETVMLRDGDSVVEQLHWFRQQGMRIALDDFGVGYSALSYLQRYPFDKVKLDRIFVNELTQSRLSKAIVRAVIGLCADLGMATTAEGVETEEQMAVLRAEGCNEVQGYLFSRPCPAAEVPALIRDIDQRTEWTITHLAV